MTTTIMNVGRVPLHVGIIQISTGKKGSVRVMGRGRGTLNPGYKIDPNWMALNGKNIRVTNSTPIVATKTVAPTVTTANTVTTATTVSTTTPAPTVPTKGATT